MYEGNKLAGMLISYIVFDITQISEVALPTVVGSLQQ